MIFRIVLAYEDSFQQHRESDLIKSFVVGSNEVKNLENMHSSFTISKKERDPFQDFIKILNERYKELKIELIGKNKPL